MLPMVAQGQNCKIWKEAIHNGDLPSQLREASGMAASRKFPGRLYHINDSGDSGTFYITGMDGKGAEAIRVMDFEPRDTEALSLGPCPGDQRSSCLYLGDIGDNNRRRNFTEIAVVEEKQSFQSTVNARQRLKLRYPDGPHDAESMAVHPNGAIFILTKEKPARLFRANPRLAEQTLTAVTTIDVESAPTDMAISDDGMRLLVLTYADAFEYGMDFKEHQKIPLTYLQQQESVAYLPGSRSFLYTTERLLPFLHQWIMKVDCGDPN
jgi:hypothetical protein